MTTPASPTKPEPTPFENLVEYHNRLECVRERVTISKQFPLIAHHQALPLNSILRNLAAFQTELLVPQNPHDDTACLRPESVLKREHYAVNAYFITIGPLLTALNEVMRKPIAEMRDAGAVEPGSVLAHLDEMLKLGIGHLEMVTQDLNSIALPSRSVDIAGAPFHPGNIIGRWSFVDGIVRNRLFVVSPPGVSLREATDTRLLVKHMTRNSPTFEEDYSIYTNQVTDVRLTKTWGLKTARALAAFLQANTDNWSWIL